MLGLPKPCHLDDPIAVSLDDLVPRNNGSRHLENKRDLSFVRKGVTELYAEWGRLSMAGSSYGLA